MHWRGLRIWIILLVLSLSLGAFFGVRWLYYTYSIDEPLNRYLKNNPLVQSYEISRSKNVLQVKILLVPTENLKDTYQEVTQGIQTALNGRPFEIKLQDNRDEQLKQAFYYIQFAAHEAIMQGNFRDMISYIDDQAKAVKAQAAVFVDQDRVYFQMKHDKHYLYEVIPRRFDKISYPPSE